MSLLALDESGLVPAGFYAVVHHSGLEWRTNNKPSLVNESLLSPAKVTFNSVGGPSGFSADICIEVYASFKF
jgi:hypothetical protein